MPLTAASPPSHLLSDVPILLSHGGTTGCKWPKSPRVGGLSVTCRVTQQPTDAIVEEQRQQEGSLSTGKQDDVLILWFQWYVAGQVSIVILPKQAGQNGPKQVGQKGNCCFLGRPRSRLVRKRQSSWVRWALSQGQCAVRASSAHRRRSSVGAE